MKAAKITNNAVNALAVFYDQDCGLCRACRRWLMSKDKYFPVEFLPYQSSRAREICPNLDRLNPDKEIVVMSDNGQIYQGGSAWVMCLYALKNYRELSFKLAHPMLLPLAKKMCHIVSARRMSISSLICGSRENLARELINADSSERCKNGSCEV